MRPPTTRKKMSVPIPEKKIAVFGLKPIIIGARTVAPNMASTCCRPTKIVCPQGSLSSGAMIPSFLRVQPVKYPRFSTVAMRYLILLYNLVENSKNKLLRLYQKGFLSCVMPPFYSKNQTCDEEKGEVEDGVIIA